MLSETFDERLMQWFDPEHYERSDTNFIINESGLELECVLGNDSLKFHLESKKCLKYLNKRNVADIIIIEFIEPRNTRLHIIECKATVRAGNPQKNSSWSHIKKQFEGALLNALGVLGVFNLSESNINDVLFYTAFINDKLRSDKAQPSILRNYRNQINEWDKDNISILSLPQAPHKKIQLNPEGKGLIRL